MSRPDLLTLSFARKKSTLRKPNYKQHIEQEHIAKKLIELKITNNIENQMSV